MGNWELQSYYTIIIILLYLYLYLSPCAFLYDGLQSITYFVHFFTPPKMLKNGGVIKCNAQHMRKKRHGKKPLQFCNMNNASKIKGLQSLGCAFF